MKSHIQLRSLIAFVLAFLPASCQAAPTAPPATDTPPATATSLLPTSTPIPPTATAIPPTSTPAPPTATPIPPTNTPKPSATPLPTATPTQLLPDLPLYSIVYSGEDGMIYLAKSDGSAVSALTAADGNFISPAWSPANQILALAGFGENGPAIFASDLQGKQPTLLYQPPDASNLTDIRNLQWSFDGQWLVYETSAFNQGFPIVALVKKDGSGLQTLPTTGEPAWSPVANVYAHVGMTGFNVYGIVLENLSDGKSTVLASPATAEGDGCQRAAWSPDGTQLTLSCVVGNKHDLYVASADGQKVTKVADSTLGVIDSAWSPDGQWLAYNTGGEVSIVKPDGSEAKRVASGQNLSLVQWSPDGTRLAYMSNANNQWALMIILADGTFPIQVATGLAGSILSGYRIFSWVDMP